MGVGVGDAEGLGVTVAVGLAVGFGVAVAVGLGVGIFVGIDEDVDAMVGLVLGVSVVALDPVDSEEDSVGFADSEVTGEQSFDWLVAEGKSSSEVECES